MRRSVICAVAAIACAMGCAQPERVAKAAAKERPAAVRGETKAVMVEKGPVIDGTLDSPLWKKCPPLEVGYATSKKAGPVRTTARVLFDPTHVYLGVDCEEPDTKGIKRAVTQRDGPVYTDDSIEFFVTGDPRQWYYQFCFNTLGTVMDASFKPGRSGNKSWNGSAVAKATIQGGKRWILTVSIPLKELSAYVGNDQAWVMNINRNRRAGKGGMFSWSVMETTDWHAVNDYGTVDGVNIVKRADGVTRVAAAIPKPPKYLTGTESGGVLVYTKVAELTFADKGKGTQHHMPLPIKGSRGLKIGFLARGAGGVKSVPFNVFDARARDNTTPKTYYWVDEQWRPILYRVNLFRYNAVIQSTVAPATDFRSIFFHGNRTGGKGVLYLKNFVVYRGEDRAAPAEPTGLTAKVTSKGVQLSWTAATDNVGTAGYAVSCALGDGPFFTVARCALPAFVARPSEDGTCRYRVLALDFQENMSAWSDTVTVKVATPFMPEKSSRLDQDRHGYREHVRKVYAAGAGKVVKGRVVCYGDSLTGATNYRHYVASCLGNYEVIACGYPAQRTSYGKRRAEEHLKKYNPEFCLVLFGTNNSKHPRNLPAAMDDLLAIAKACEQNGTVPVIGTIPPRGFRDPESKPEAGFNAALMKTCRDNKIPIAYIFEAYQNSGVDRRKLLAGDGVHTVSGGWVCMGKAWRAAMDHVRYALLDRP